MLRNYSKGVETDLLPFFVFSIIFITFYFSLCYDGLHIGKKESCVACIFSSISQSMNFCFILTTEILAIIGKSLYILKFRLSRYSPDIGFLWCLNLTKFNIFLCAAIKYTIIYLITDKVFFFNFRNSLPNCHSLFESVTPIQCNNHLL